jgi:DNA excision repair protein ERCC-2
MSDVTGTGRMKPTLSLSVRTLVEATCRAGDLESAGFGAVDPVEAIRAHQRIQKARPQEYTSEVSVSRRVETERFFVDIEGRIDGVYELPDKTIIDEIKTTNRDLDELVRQNNALHWAQAQCYAALYAAEYSLASVTVQLTYYHMEARRIREVQRVFDRLALESFFIACVNRYAAWMARVADWQAQRNAALLALNFPYGEYRPGQRTMAAQVYRAIRDSGQLLAQAPTGIGKTMASLFPAFKAMGEGCCEKVFFLTARTTGRITAEKSLANLRNAGARIKSVSLVAKQKACANATFSCTPDDCPYARGYYDRLDAANEEAFDLELADSDALRGLALKHMLCPFEFSLELSLWADCIICDYNYVFDPRVYLRRFFEVDKANVSLLIDEAHNLIDRSREMFSAQLDLQSVSAARKAARGAQRSVSTQLGRIEKHLQARRPWTEEGEAEREPFFTEREAPLELIDILQHFIFAASKWLARNVPHPGREAMLELYFNVSFFVNISALYNKRYLTLYESSGDNLSVKLFCIDPSANMAAALERVRSTVFFSSTLTPMHYFRDVLGCRPDIKECVIPSPFPPRHCGVFIHRSISTLYNMRQQTSVPVAESLDAMVRARKGNYLCFFPSYEYLRMVLQEFTRLAPGVETVIQTSDLTEAQRTEFLDRFSADNTASLVGFAIMGGVFGEGIDLLGERLSGAAIVGVGLPGISHERELVRDYYNHTGSGYDFAYRYPGLTRVLQAAGRVIRSETDRGVILLIDNRYIDRRYRPLLPKTWWTQVIGDTPALTRGITDFWQTGGVHAGT